MTGQEEDSTQSWHHHVTRRAAYFLGVPILIHLGPVPCTPAGANLHYTDKQASTGTREQPDLAVPGRKSTRLALTPSEKAHTPACAPKPRALLSASAFPCVLQGPSEGIREAGTLLGHACPYIPIQPLPGQDRVQKGSGLPGWLGLSIHFSLLAPGSIPRPPHPMPHAHLLPSQ